MKYFYTTQQNETISVKIEASPVWELILGISGYTYAQLRHTFDLDEKWTLAGYLSSLDALQND